MVSRLSSAADRHVTSMAAASYFRHELYTPGTREHVDTFGTWIRWYWPGPGYSSWNAWARPHVGGLHEPRDCRRHREPLDGQPPATARTFSIPAWRNIGIGAVQVRDPRGYYASWDDVTIVAAEFGARR